MSKSGEEDDECFYDSLDRIASSSQTTSSCSSSDNEESSANSPNHDSPFPVPKFPMRVVKYDIWVSEPLSVQDRRTRLLREMGLSSDPSLTRVKPIFRSDYREKSNGEFGRSASSGRLRNQRQSPGESSSMSRSKSDSAAEIDSRNDHSSVSSRILSFDSSSSSLSVNNYRHNHTHNDKHNKFVIELPSSRSYGSPAASPNKPPIGRNCRKLDELGANSVSSGPNWMSNSPPVVENRKVDEDLGHNGLDKKSEQACTIKNLDNGEEFVVKEFREDGMWNKLKEVGTGRQLTMEEFDMTVGHSPIVQELMRRQSVEEGNKDNVDSNANGNSGSGPKLKKKSSWFKSIKNVAGSVTGQKERRSSDERDTSSEKGGRRSSSATDDSQDTSFHGPERVRVRHYGKSCKELTALYKTQEIQAHNGSIWSIKFSLDGRYLASAGEDCFIHVWQVLESSERKGDLLIDKREDMNLNLLFMPNGSPEASSLSPNLDNHLERKRRGRPSLSRKSVSLDHVIVPETIFALSEKPICSFQGHLDDVLDLSWSKSQHLLSSSMDKTVRLWHLSSRSCLKIFSHSDYVTCIHFNPVDDGYFISGSLDGKVRIWSIPDRQVVDWNDLHEMVTAACYTPDGQSALVGSYKGSCHLYNTSENKLQQKSKINLQNKKKKSHHKKITGFQFAPGSLSEVLVTSADSRIRVIDGVDMVHKFKGFRNTNSQIAASFTSNGKYVVCASEDSHVYVWKHEHDPRPSKSKGVVTVTSSYEHSHCQDVSVAIPWPGISESLGPQDPYLGGPDGLHSQLDDPPTTNHPPTPVENTGGEVDSARTSSSIHETISSATNSYFFDRISATWPEEKLLRATKSHSPRVSMDLCNGVIQNRSAWGLVIVTAGLRGEIRTFQNFGLPVRI